VDFVPVLLSSAISVVLFLLLVAGVVKVFQIATDLRELKDVLQDIKRNLQDTKQSLPTAPAGPLSPQELVRAIHAQSYEEAVADPK
jgi:hypothetical protein